MPGANFPHCALTSLGGTMMTFSGGTSLSRFTVAITAFLATRAAAENWSRRLRTCIEASSSLWPPLAAFPRGRFFTQQVILDRCVRAVSAALWVLIVVDR